jgi:thiol-disulfide isomerase/thioredoxin
MRFVPVLATAMALAAPGLLVAPARAAELICRPDYDYSVEVDGGYPQGACFYKAEDAYGKWFIDIPSNKTGLLLDLTAKRVVNVPRDRITAAQDSRLKIRDDVPPGATAYAYSVDGRILQFQADEMKVRILPVTERPPITGSTTIGELEMDRPEYREGMKAYTPDAAAIAFLKKYGKPVEIDAYFATWCPHCKIYMPKLLRAMKDTGNQKITLNLVGVPKGFGEKNGPWSGKNVTAVPTIIVKVEGREITRMGAHEGAVPETELVDILKAVR